MRFKSDLSSTVDCLSNKIVYRNQIGEKRWLKKLKVKWRQRYSFGYGLIGEFD
jgi:hypothetical protein